MHYFADITILESANIPTAVAFWVLRASARHHAARHRAAHRTTPITHRAQPSSTPPIH